MKTGVIRLLGLTLIILSVIACKENKRKYYFFNSSDKVPNKVIVAGDVKNGKENGIWQIFDGKDTALLTQGHYSEGLKTGKWTYVIFNEKKIVNWKIYEDKKNKLVVNLPDDWDIINYNKVLLTAIFKPKSKISQTKFFAILRQDTSNIHLSLDQYYRMSVSELISNYKVTSQKYFLLKNKEQKIYFSSYSVIKHGEPVLLLSYIFSIAGQIYDFSYSSSDQDPELKRYIITDIVQHCYVYNQRLIDPFKSIEVIPVIPHFKR